MAQVQEQEQYDVFLSYARRDQELVERVARDLRDAGVKVWFDEWALVPGESLRAVGASFGRARLVAAFLGPSGLDKRQNKELEDVLLVSGSDRQTTVIPVLLPGAEPQNLPPFLRNRTAIKVGDPETYFGELSRLISAI